MTQPTSGAANIDVVRVTDPDDARPLGQLIANAFDPLDPTRWLVDEFTPRRLVMPRFFALDVEHGLHSGVVYTTADRNGVLIWLPYQAAPLPDYLDRLHEAVGPDLFHRFVTFGYHLDRYRAPDCDVLTILAVDPAVQGKGIGTALLRHLHAALDAVTTPAYLEAANLPDRDYYKARGWFDHGNPFVLPESGPPMFPMWRPPTRPSRYGNPGRATDSLQQERRPDLPTTAHVAAFA